MKILKQKTQIAVTGIKSVGQIMRIIICFFIISLQVSAFGQLAIQKLGEKAKSHVDNGDFATAQELYKQLVARDSTNYLWYQELGDCFQHLKDYNQAIENYNAAEKLKGADAQILLKRGAAKMSNEDYAGAIKDFNASIKLDPKNPDAFFNRGGAKYLAFKVGAAIKDYDKAIALDPNYAEAYYYRGVSKGELEDFDGGIDDIQTAMIKNSSLQVAAFNIAVIKFEAEDYKAAIADFDAILENKPTNLAEIYYYRAESYYYLGEKEKACEDWKAAGELGDKDALDYHQTFCVKGNKLFELKKRRPTTITF